MLLDESVELTDDERVPARGELALEALLERGEASLLERRDLQLRPRLVREVGKRRPAPQRERLVRLPGCAQALEARQIELVLVDAEEIAGTAGDDPLGAKIARSCEMMSAGPSQRWPAGPRSRDPRSALGGDQLMARSSRIASSARTFGAFGTTSNRRRAPRADRARGTPWL